MVIWLTGLSGSGKTTLSKNIYKNLKLKNPQVVIIDNDEIRDVLGTENLGFDEQSRIIKAKKIQKLALMLSSQKLFVIVCATYTNDNISSWNKKNFHPFYEIFLSANINTVMERDPKGLYKLHKEGKMDNIVGIDVPWHQPKNPDIIINEKMTLLQSTNLIIDKVKYFKS